MNSGNGEEGSKSVGGSLLQLYGWMYVYSKKSFFIYFLFQSSLWILVLEVFFLILH